MKKQKKLQKILDKIRRNKVALALIVWFGFTWSWALFADSLDLAGSSRQGFILAVLVTAINVALSVFIAKKMLNFVDNLNKRRGKRWLFILGLPLFALLDFLVCWLVAFIWIGPEGSIDNILPMGSLALPLVNTPLKFASRFLGFYGLAAVGWFTIYLFCKKELRKFALLLIAGTALLSLLGWQLYKTPNGQPVSVTLVSETLKDRVPIIEGNRTDLVVFPEYGLDKSNDQYIWDRIKQTKPGEPRTAFIGSEQIYKTDKVGHKNNLMFGNSEQGVVQREDKFRLIQGGEDLPFAMRLLLRATGQVSTLDYFSYAKGVIKGDQQLKPFVLRDGVSVAAAVCSSIISPADYRDFTRSGATVFTNSASLGIFQGSPLFTWEQKSLARFMAIANSRYFLQSANKATAYALDNNGNQIGEVKGINTLSVTAVTNSKKTPYTYLGEWLAWLGAIIVLGLAGTPRLRKLRSTLAKR